MRDHGEIVAISVRRRGSRSPGAKGVSGLVAGVLLVCGVACGSGNSSPAAPSPAPVATPAPVPAPPPAPTPPPSSVRVVTITSSGVNPGDVQTAVGTRVMFVNNDTIAHDIMGGPDPTRPDCHEIDSVGFLSPGQSRQTAPFERARLCEYHDHSYHSTLFNGRILIQ
jgi:plastocyanin